MNIKKITFMIGSLFIIAAVMGFIPALNVHPHINDPTMSVEGNYGRLLGLFPVNVLHNLAHLALGIWGIIAARSTVTAIHYNQIGAVLYGVLALAGLLPGLNTFFGMIPLFSHDVWLHGLFAVAMGYLGFAPASAPIKRRLHAA